LPAHHHLMRCLKYGLGTQNIHSCTAYVAALTIRLLYISVLAL
jgi:hypothetical protein